ncbi:MAG: glycosyltransferase [Rhodoglobus sp.]
MSRYLIVADYSLSYLGGAQTAIVRQASALAAGGHTVGVVAPQTDTFASELRRAGVVVIDPPFFRVIPGIPVPIFLAHAPLLRWMTQKLEGFVPDVVLIHSEFGLSVAAMRVAQERGILVIHTIHTFFFQASPWLGFLSPLAGIGHWFATRIKAPRIRLAKRPFDSALRRMTLAIALKADWVLSPSHHQAARLREAGVRRISVVSNTTSPEAVSSHALHRSVSDGPLRLVWAARFAPEKRLAVALEAVALANDLAGKEAITLQVAGGSGPATPGVTFHGRISESRVRELLASADAALITSVGFDNQPMIALEAFARGKPVIVSDPVLAQEFKGPALEASGPSGADLSALLLELVARPDRLTAAAAAASFRAEQQTAEAHTQAIESLVLSLRDRAH